MTSAASKSALARHHWVAASHFHPLHEREVLGEILARITRLHAEGGTPVLLLDLDSTLYEVAPRTLQIIQEWLRTEEGKAHPEVLARLHALTHAQLGYSVQDTFHALGLDLEHPGTLSVMDAIKRFWHERFFTSRYLPYDHAYPGAAEFTRRAHAAGARIVYLTGRDEPNMGAGTRANLQRDGFPWEVPNTHLLLKAAYDLPDLGHKTGAAQFVREKGTLVASFENEPANLVALYDLFPEAMHVFMETVCSEHATLPRQGLYRIRGFSL